MNTTILDKIITNKITELRNKKAKLSLTELMIKIKQTSYRQRDFISSIITPGLGDTGLIGEIKLASPSAGPIGSKEEIIERAQQYVAGGADAISVVTDNKFFNGELSFVPQLKNIVNVPVLQKDFVLDRYQVYEAKSAGVDAILLMAKIVDARRLKKLVSVAHELGLEPVVEVTSEVELKTALVTPARCIGVNARNLEDFTVDIRKACALGKKIPQDKVFIGFSGVKDRSDIEKYKRAGAKAVLVGTSLMQTNNIVKTIQELKNI